MVFSSHSWTKLSAIPTDEQKRGAVQKKKVHINTYMLFLLFFRHPSEKTDFQHYQWILIPLTSKRKSSSEKRFPPSTKDNFLTITVGTLQQERTFKKYLQPNKEEKEA